MRVMRVQRLIACLRSSNSPEPANAGSLRGRVLLPSSLPNGRTKNQKKKKHGREAVDDASTGCDSLPRTARDYFRDRECSGVFRLSSHGLKSSLWLEYEGLR